MNTVKKSNFLVAVGFELGEVAAGPALARPSVATMAHDDVHPPILPTRPLPNSSDLANFPDPLCI
jgi:hypothetical protein